jgi:hypothetical protein
MFKQPTQDLPLQSFPALSLSRRFLLDFIKTRRLTDTSLLL